MDREDIYIISRNSNWSTKNVDTTLKQDVYNDVAAWKKFLRLFLLILAIGFVTAGILFFFTYNWYGLNKFLKIGLIELIIIIITCIALFAKTSLLIKNILLTAVSVLVGALFAVFGQIYQSGATAYDFFLAWTVFVTIWVVITNYAVLWAFFLYLVNATFTFYVQLETSRVSEHQAFLVVILMNGIWLLLFLLLSKKFSYFILTNWLKNFVFICIVSVAAFSVWEGIMDKFDPILYVLITCTLVIYLLGLRYAFAQKNLIFLSIIPFSFIFIITAFPMKVLPSEWVFLINGIFVMVSVGYLIKYLLLIQKSEIWKS
jgi:uncharacterized membrane protein